MSSEARLAHAIACGAHDGLVYPAALEPGSGGKALAARFKALLPQGADVVFDPVGGDYAEAALRSLENDAVRAALARAAQAAAARGRELGVQLGQD